LGQMEREAPCLHESVKLLLGRVWDWLTTEVHNVAPVYTTDMRDVLQRAKPV
jgi:hypothetical protein